MKKPFKLYFSLTEDPNSQKKSSCDFLQTTLSYSDISNKVGTKIASASNIIRLNVSKISINKLEDISVGISGSLW